MSDETVGETAGHWPARLAPSAVATPPAASTARRSWGTDVIARDGQLLFRARGHDVVARSQFDLVTVDRVSLVMVLTDTDEPQIESIDVDLDADVDAAAAEAACALQTMVGRHGRRGVRTATDQLLAAAGVEAGALLRAILHDVPIGVALRRAAEPPDEPFLSVTPYRPPVDICAGHRAGGVLNLWNTVRGPRRLGVGPPTQPIGATDDESLLLDLGERLPGTASRRRRLDVAAQGAHVVFESAFRDSVIERSGPVGAETVVHEYVVSGSSTPDRTTIAECAARAVVLPAPDCPAAAASATRLAGVSFADVEREIGESFIGTSTCTHLNDALWILGGVPALLAEISSYSS